VAEVSQGLLTGTRTLLFFPGALLGITSIVRTDEEWKALLTPEQYRVLRKAGTEYPFSGEYNETTAPGLYHCVGCDNLLFDSQHKLECGCGWPAFSAPADATRVVLREENSGGIPGVEVLCAVCQGHLGHVFEEETETGFRYCINSVCLQLRGVE